jgi:hypothetical protein
MPDELPAAVKEAKSMLAQLASSGVQTRALGGVAIALRCPSARTGPLRRAYHDLDLAVKRSDARPLKRALIEMGFGSNERFNALHGRTRLIFVSPAQTHIDIIVGEFEMCHKLDFSDRLGIDQETLSLADLCLTKLQVAELNHKDAGDLAALFLDNPLTDDESGINAPYVEEVLGRDWGWWRTATANLELLEHLLPTFSLAPEQREKALDRVIELRRRAGLAKKSRRWKARARLGERVPWRSIPEEVGTPTPDL